MCRNIPIYFEKDKNFIKKIFELKSLPKYEILLWFLFNIFTNTVI